MLGFGETIEKFRVSSFELREGAATPRLNISIIVIPHHHYHLAPPLSSRT